MSHPDAQSPRVKRRKLDSANERSNQSATAAIITSHVQLRDLLVFQQNANDSKHGINRFKEFLNSIKQTEREEEKAKKLRVLKTFCDSQISRHGEDDEETVTCFPDVIQTWSFADSNNHEPLLTVVPSVLALFIRTVSSHLEFREFGLTLCKSLLQKEQLRLLNRGLTANKAREHLISPCLRLLTEIVSFDGGAVASLVYSKRHVTFKRIEVFLTPNKAQLETSADEINKSTLRRNALRYVLANLKFQHVAAKGDIIDQYKVIRALFEFVRKDPRDIVIDIVNALDRDVIQDEALSRSAKTKFFNRGNLERLATLYGYDRDSEEPVSDDVSVANEVHKTLMKLCQNTSLGVLLPETGWYPAGSEPDTLPTEDDTSIELGLDSALYVDKYRESVPVRNGILSHLAQVLRPDVDSLQIELLLTMFKAAPELVADFFAKKTMFVSDPKPTSSWMGESAFLFSTVQLPVPTHCGWKDKLPSMPPPVSVVIESILPRPLTQKILARCLNQNTDVVTLFAVRILTVSLAKLRKVLKLFLSEHGSAQTFWIQAADKLVAEFCRRCPTMKDVILLYKRTDKEDLQQQEAVAELLASFYEVVPDVAFDENFDVSLNLVDVLKRLEQSDLKEDDAEALLSQLQNLLKIAQQSASLRWWQQPASMQYSAFTSVFKILVGAGETESSRQIRRLLQNVLVENAVLANSPDSFSALIASFHGSAPEIVSAPMSFFDNCVCRVAKKPVHYQDIADWLCDGESSRMSLVVAAIAEQWPFVVKNGDASTERNVAAWIARLLGELKKAKEDPAALKAARDNLVNATGDKESTSLLKKSLKGVDEPNSVSDANKDTSVPATVSDTAMEKGQVVDLVEIFGTLPTEGKTHNALHRWEKEELEVAVEQGRIAELMLCLCSDYEEVRRQAISNLARFMVKLKDSKYVEWRSVYILTGELLETINHSGLEKPIPWIVAECATSCLAVLTSPLHRMFGKVNLFLQKAPSWEVEKLPSYWIDKILLHEPELDDGYFEEVNWLLDLLVKGLRSQADMDIYRRANVFERVLSFYQSPSLGAGAQRKILHLVYRATQAGGSTTLITRAGAVSWLQSQLPVLNQKEMPLGQALAGAVYSSSDRERVDAWSGGTLGAVIEDILA